MSAVQDCGNRMARAKRAMFKVHRNIFYWLFIIFYRKLRRQLQALGGDDLNTYFFAITGTDFLRKACSICDR